MSGKIREEPNLLWVHYTYKFSIPKSAFGNGLRIMLKYDSVLLLDSVSETLYLVYELQYDQLKFSTKV